MNQRGEATLFMVLILVALSGLLTLCGLELEHSLQTLKKRTQLFLCLKETKGELNNYLKLMGRTNWALKNITKVQMVALFIPGLQSAALEADKMKRAIKVIQNGALGAYGAKLFQLRNKGCPVDPQLILTPFKLSGSGYARKSDDTAILRKKKWTYYFLKKPYLLTLDVETSALESIHPIITYQAKEKGAMLSSLLSSH